MFFLSMSSLPIEHLKMHPLSIHRFILCSVKKARIPVELDLPSDLPISVASTDFDSELEPEDKMEKYINNLLGVRDDLYTNKPITT
jgi:hypothetical protein